jgi:hypothetical protein
MRRQVRGRSRPTDVRQLLGMVLILLVATTCGAAGVARGPPCFGAQLWLGAMAEQGSLLRLGRRR